MTAHFASATDTREQIPQVEELGPGCYGFISAHDPNCGFVVGRDAVLVVDTRATPKLGRELLTAVRSVTDRPVRYVFLTHYHAVRALGASVFDGATVLSTLGTRDWIRTRGEADFKSERERFPRLFAGVEEIPGLTHPHVAFEGRLSLDLGGLEVEFMGFGRAHTQGDAACWVASSSVLYAGDLVENRCGVYAGDAYITDWIETLTRLAPLPAEAMVSGRGAVVRGAEIAGAIAGTSGFLSTLRRAVAAGRDEGLDLAGCFRAAEEAMRPEFGDWPLFGHVLPFDVARMHEELGGTEHPTIWTAERDQELWNTLRG
ncbi:MBL fold metallo-hydrolase [Roseomonas sp. BN140053]|uniref:MBL fold metallo-hydrolase n=1 Tax=Roseomonas sp. BN140053 TaxID=3391898 RepID=UPI0039EA88FE